jgi:hypothetical protein
MLMPLGNLQMCKRNLKNISGTVLVKHLLIFFKVGGEALAVSAAAMNSSASLGPVFGCNAFYLSTGTREFNF